VTAVNPRNWGGQQLLEDVVMKADIQLQADHVHVVGRGGLAPPCRSAYLPDQTHRAPKRRLCGAMPENSVGRPQATQQPMPVRPPASQLVAGELRTAPNPS
jgi:hypothetical protein